MDPGLHPDDAARIWSDTRHSPEYVRGFLRGMEHRHLIDSRRRVGGLVFAAALFLGLVLLAFAAGRAQAFAASRTTAQASDQSVMGADATATWRESRPPQPSSGALRVVGPTLSAPPPLSLPVPATPRPSGGVGEPAQAVRGRASWFATGPSGMFAAAGPRLRVGDWRGRIVRVCGLSTCIRVMLSDWCACPARVIDLDAAAFARLGPLSRGVLDVTVSW